MTGRGAVIGLPLGWLAVFFAAPLAIVLAISLSQPVTGVPPFAPLVARDAAGALAVNADLANYGLLLSDPLYAGAYLTSLRIAATATAAALLIGYPMAYAIARAPRAWRGLLLLAVMLPFWTSFLIRIYAWMALLNANGVVNQALLGLGLIDAPLALLHNEAAVHLGIVYAYLPFMVLPLYAVLERLDPALLEAAGDLGARPWAAFATVTLPLSWRGVAAGCLLVFVPALGEFVIPDLLGGGNVLMIGGALWAEFFSNRDWPLAAAIAVAVLAAVVAPAALVERLVRPELR
ncbi:MAG: ABC transporter permease subunit [Rhodospirillales bacterium]